MDPTTPNNGEPHANDDVVRTADLLEALSVDGEVQEARLRAWLAGAMPAAPAPPEARGCAPQQAAEVWITLLSRASARVKRSIVAHVETLAPKIRAQFAVGSYCNDEMGWRYLVPTASILARDADGSALVCQSLQWIPFSWLICKQGTDVLHGALRVAFTSNSATLADVQCLARLANLITLAHKGRGPTTWQAFWGAHQDRRVRPEGCALLARAMSLSGYGVNGAYDKVDYLWAEYLRRGSPSPGQLALLFLRQRHAAFVERLLARVPPNIPEACRRALIDALALLGGAHRQDAQLGDHK